MFRIRIRTREGGEFFGQESRGDHRDGDDDNETIEDNKNAIMKMMMTMTMLRIEIQA